MIVTSIQLNDLRLFEWPVHIVKVGWEFKKQKKECHIFPFSKWVCLALQFTYAWVTYAYCQKWGGFQKKKEKKKMSYFPMSNMNQQSNILLSLSFSFELLESSVLLLHVLVLCTFHFWAWGGPFFCFCSLSWDLHAATLYTYTCDSLFSVFWTSFWFWKKFKRKKNISAFIFFFIFVGFKRKWQQWK